ncbi:hypothetical protein [Isoptericola croceus]|uniref:hypothetical protein n=1 Tax=Isoptericola croceus TaxID=3031406 RepID=UPI0023F84B7E|nr:hypothetical protein [Isoptericola croceus]
MHETSGMPEGFDGAGSEPRSAFIEHFAFLCADSADRELLTEVAQRVTVCDIAPDGSAHAVLLWDDVEHELVCAPPFTGQVGHGVPASYAAIAGTHNGVSWDAYGGGPLGFPGLDADGLPAGFGQWEWDTLEVGDNEEVIARLDGAGIALQDLWEAFGSGQNWILFDPLRTTAGAEMALVFVSHDSAEWEPVESTVGVGYGAVLLWQLADYFLDTELIVEQYT